MSGIVGSAVLKHFPLRLRARFPRSEDSRRLLDRSVEQLLAQADGAEPTPWPGPF